MLMPSGSISTIDITTIPLTAAYIVDLAKEVIQSTPRCDWSRCNIELNSWKSLQEVQFSFIYI